LGIVDVGVSGVPAVFLVLFILLPLQFVFAYRASLIGGEITGLVTQRVHLMSEIITTIKVLKFYAWERYYLDKISRRRQVELSKIHSGLVYTVSILVVVFIAPMIAAFVSLIAFYHLNPLKFDSETVFSLISLFNTLRYPLLLLPQVYLFIHHQAVRSATAARESLSRLQEFLARPEIDPPIRPLPVPRDSPNTLCMRITNARFEWGDGEIEHPHIPDLNLDLHRGLLYGIIGDVGSCKTLLGAIMGQLKMTKGSVGTFYKVVRFRTREVLPGFEDGEDYGAPVFKFGYVPQEPWLIDGSLRDNIVFGEEWYGVLVNSRDDDKYAEVVRVSGLIKDMMALAEGDQSDLADLALTPSQKQRISLARFFLF
jgi:ABC-type multidrug transport system fused ATPase/permease subunit